jgi:predicted permease
MEAILQAVLPPFAVVGVGFLLQKIRRIELEPLIDVAMMVAAPCLAFSVLTHTHVSGGEVWGIAASSACVVIGSGILGWLVLKAARLPLRGLLMPIMFMNAANLPFPITKFYWQEEGLARAVIFYIVVATLVFTLGIAIASGRAGWKRVIMEPMVWATIAAFGLKGLEWEMPVALDRGVGLLGEAAIPLVLLILGMQLERTRLDSVPAAARAAFARMGGGLLLGITFAYLFGLQGRARDVVILCSAMPPAMITSAIALRFKADPERVAATVLLGTLASLIVLPLVLWCL